MYELWLAANIVFELALMYLPFVAAVAIVLAGLYGLALSKGLRLFGAWRAALAAGVVVTVAGVLLVPGMTKSSLWQLAYWVDWANLFAVAAGFGALAMALALPIAALAKGAPATGRAAAAMR